MTNSEKALQMHEQWSIKKETTTKTRVNSRDELSGNNILPKAFDPRVAEAVSKAVKDLI